MSLIEAVLGPAQGCAVCRALEKLTPGDRDEFSIAIAARTLSGGRKYTAKDLARALEDMSYATVPFGSIESHRRRHA
jgi:hypothetical protein